MESTGVVKFLRKIRKELKLTQAQLNEKAGLPVGTVNQLECGKRLFDDDRIDVLAKALEIPDSDFYAAMSPRGPLRDQIDEMLDLLGLDGELATLPVLLELARKKGSVI